MRSESLVVNGRGIYGVVDKFRLPECLEASERILIAGAGGGFDVYAGLPIFYRLRSLGKQVFLANLSFTYLRGTDAEEVYPALHAMTQRTTGEDGYFPERTLARFLVSQGGLATPIYAFENTGGKHICARGLRVFARDVGS